MRRAPAKLGVLAVFLLCLGPPAHAQYMYLDSNGDGVHTDADILPATGATTVDIWLITNANRDGSAASCAVDSYGGMTLNSYEIFLAASGGTVRYSNFQNRITEFTTVFGNGQDAHYFYAGRGSANMKSAGKYRLATVTVEPQTGTPFLGIVPDAYLAPAALTSFGSMCQGLDYDNTLKLGSDWFDTDGLYAVGQSNAPPFFVTTSLSTTLDEGTTQTFGVTALDTDNDSLALSVVDAPTFLTLSLGASTGGRVRGTISLAPDFKDAGTYHSLLLCSDGTAQDTLPLTVQVRDMNRPPTITRIQDIAVTTNSTTELKIHASDPDLDLDTLKLQMVSMPAFMVASAMRSVDGGYEANLLLIPTGRDVGTWNVVYHVSDGAATVPGGFLVRVYNPLQEHPPELDSIPDFAMEEDSTATYELHGADPDDEPTSFRLESGPAFVRISDDWWWPYGPNQLVISPGRQDAGAYRASVVASELIEDGRVPLVSAPRPFTINVVNRIYPPEVIAEPCTICVEPGEVVTVAVRVSDPDGQAVTLSLGAPPLWGGLVQTGPGSAIYTLEPSSEIPPQDFRIDILATDSGGAEGSASVPIRVGAAGTCPSYVDPWGTASVIARAGDDQSVLEGEVVHLNGTASEVCCFVPRYRWDFGDGTQALGRKIDHRYVKQGTYRAILTIELARSPIPGAPGYSSYASDTLAISVGAAYPAYAEAAPETNPVVLRQAPSDMTLLIVQVGDAYQLGDVPPDAYSLWTVGSTDSIAASGVEDPVANGLGANQSGAGTRRLITFRGEDVRRLFRNVRGRQHVAVRLEGALANGALVRAPLSLDVVGAPPEGAVVVPNPMNPNAVISFAAAHSGRAVVRLFDVHGRLVRTLLDGPVDAGEVHVEVDGRDSGGRSLASGVYYYQIEAPGASWRGRATILK